MQRKIMGIFLSWKYFPPQAIPLLPLFHEKIFSCISCIFLLLLPTSQSSCSESSASFAECFTDPHSMNIKPFDVTYLYFFLPLHYEVASVTNYNNLLGRLSCLFPSPVMISFPSPTFTQETYSPDVFHEHIFTSSFTFPLRAHPRCL